MKRTILSASAILFSLFVFAQTVPNAGLENWSQKNIAFPPVSWYDPDGWATTNVVMGQDTSVTRVSGTDKYAGNYAAKIVTKKDASGLLAGAGINDTAGVMITGTISGFTLKQGFPNTAIATQIVFFSKYTPVGSDNAMASAVLTKWNGAKRDTIADGVINITTPSNTYGITQVNVTVRPQFVGITPDTCVIAVSSSNLLKPQIGSTFYVDEFQLVVGQKELDAAAKQLYAFPNPANNQLTFMIGHESAVKITVYDVTGKEVKTYPVDSRKVKADVSAYAPGLYIYRLTDKEENVLGVSKFTVH